MPQTPLTPREQAIAAEYSYWKERQRQQEAREEPKFDPTDRYIGTQHQAKADEAYQMHGRQAPAQREEESAETYRRRLLTGLQVYHPEYKDVDLQSAPQMVMNSFEKEIMQAALDPASHKVDTPPGVIREIRRKDPVNGRERSEFVASDGHTFIHEMSAQRPIQRTYAAGGKFISPLEFQAYGRLMPTEPRENAPESVRRDGPQRLRNGLPR